VRVIAALSGGGVLVGGQLAVAGTPHVPVARLGPQGEIDSSFDASGLEGIGTCWALTDDGHVMLGGSFNRRGVDGIHQVVRLEPDGRVDASFEPYRFNYSSHYMPWVSAILGAGDLTFVGGGMIRYPSGDTAYVLALLGPDGTEERRLRDVFQSPLGVRSIEALADAGDGFLFVGGRTSGTP
jgi:hypothetical protein